MDRPYIFCHMMTSLDGKIMGNYMETPKGEIAGSVFYDIAFGKNAYYKHQGWLSGRVTTDDNFTFYKEPKLDENALPVPEGDYIVEPNFGMYYVSIDPNGKLGWKNSKLVYGDVTAHIIEVLTEKASNAYKDFLRKLGISYIIAGKDKLDYEIVLSKLKQQFKIENLMLGGGGILNWSFIQQGLCDEISIVISPSADGSPKTPSLFKAVEGLSTENAIDFTLKDVKAMDGSSVWLRYEVK